MIRPLDRSARRWSWSMLLVPVSSVVVGLRVGGATVTSAAVAITLGVALGLLAGALGNWSRRKMCIRSSGGTVVLTTWRGNRVISSADAPAIVTSIPVRLDVGGRCASRVWGRDRRHVLFLEGTWDLAELDRLANNVGLAVVARDDELGLSALGRRFRGTVPTLLGSYNLLMLAIVLAILSAWGLVDWLR